MCQYLLDVFNIILINDQASDITEYFNDVNPLDYYFVCLARTYCYLHVLRVPGFII